MQVDADAQPIVAKLSYMMHDDDFHVGVEQNQMPRRRHTRWRVKPLHGFTLVELLVVISIIAMLLAILLPALAQGRETAKNVVCMSNQHQLFLAFAQYADDYSGWLPPREKPGGVFWHLGRWDTDQYYFASHERNEGAGYISYKFFYSCPVIEWNSNYALNFWLSDVDTNTIKKLWDIEQSGKTTLVADSESFPGTDNGYHYFGEQANIGWYHMNGGANILMCDGHVEHLHQREDLQLYLFDGRSYWP